MVGVVVVVVVVKVVAVVVAAAAAAAPKPIGVVTTSGIGGVTACGIFVVPPSGIVVSVLLIQEEALLGWAQAAGWLRSRKGTRRMTRRRRRIGESCVELV